MNVFSLNKCPVCSQQNVRKVFALDAGNLVRCQNCRVIFYTPRPTLADLDNYYGSQLYRDAYQAGDMVGQTFADKRYRQFNQVIIRYGLNLHNRKLLDVGCGTGEFLFAAAQNGWQVAGLEVSEETVEQANQRLGGNYVKSGLIGDIQLSSNAFDVVTSFHVIEHLLEPTALLEQAYTALKPGGILFLETPNIGSLGAKIRGKQWSQIMPPEHINYFNPTSLFYALKQAGFARTRVFTIRPQKIQSLLRLKGILKHVAAALYEVAPLLNLGASLQAIATKPQT